MTKKYFFSSIAALFSILPFGMSYFWEDVSSNGAKVCWYKLLDISCLWNREQTEPFNNVFFLIFFAALAYIYAKIYEKISKNRRLIVFSSCLAACFAIFEVFGHSLAAISGLEEIFGNAHNFVKSCVRIVGYFFIFMAAIAFAFENIIPKISKFDIKPQKFLVPSKKNFFFCIGGGYFLYSLFVFKYWPMVYGFDTIEYITQVFDYKSLTNHHPVFNAWILVPFIKFGLFIGNVNYGIFLAVLIQIAIISTITAYAIQTILKLEIPRIIKLSAIVFYAIYPVYAHQAATLCKDTPFGYSMLVFVLCLLKLGLEKENFFKSKLNIFLSIISIVLMILHRNNGFHVAILSMPFVIWFCKGKFRKIATFSTVGIILFYALWGWFITKMGVIPGWEQEKYSLISQQFGRIAKTENLSDEDKTEMQKYLTCSTERLADVYLPEVSDPTKALLNPQEFKADLFGFLSFSIKMMFKYPLESLNGFLSTTYGFWYIEYVDCPGGGGSLHDYPAHNQLTKQFVQKEIFKNPIANFADKIMQKRNIPIVSLFFRCGFIVWIFLFCFTYCWYRKNYKTMLIFAPLFALWFTCLASPYSNYRYIFGIATTIPVFVASIFVGNDNNLKE